MMKTIFNKQSRDELIGRINSLDENNNAQWGKMNVYQMVKHCSYWSGWILGDGNHIYQQTFVGKLLGKMILRKMIKNENPFDKNIPTSTQFKVKEMNGNFENEKSNWISYTREFDNYDNPCFIHDFFGKMNKKEIGILVYKHSDHHLRQFGA